jgi:hypothetical protein
MATLFTIGVVVTFLLVIFSARSSKAAAYSANLIWSGIAVVALLVTAGIAVWRGNLSLAVKDIVVLVAILLMTGIIPGLLVLLRRHP